MTSLAPWNWGMTKAAEQRDPFTALQREINRAFDSLWDGSDHLPAAFLRGAPAVPKVDVSETDQEVHVTMELPGMSEQDLEVELTDNVLRVKGEKKDNRETKGCHFHRVERSFGMFERAVPLPAKVNRDAVAATFKNGVLEVQLPKAQPSNVHQKITVKGG